MLRRNEELGAPTAIEGRDTFHPQFFADLLSWASLSAQSEPLQELCSGLSLDLTPSKVSAATGAGGASSLSARLSVVAGGRRHAHAPAFPKPKPAGWWLVLGDADEIRGVAVRRLCDGAHVAAQSAWQIRGHPSSDGDGRGRGGGVDPP